MKTPRSFQRVAGACAAVLVGMLSALSPAPAAAQALLNTLPATNLEQAAGLLMGQMAVNDVRRSLCGEAYPELRRSADVETFKWQQRHVAEIAAARGMLGKEGMEKLKLVDAAQRKKAAELFGLQMRRGGEHACTDFIERLHSGAEELARRSPDASRLLAGYTREHPQDVTARRQVEDVGTCALRGLESGASYRVILPYCDCVIDKALPLVDEADRASVSGSMPLDQASLIRQTSERLASNPEFLKASQQCARESGLLAELQAAGSRNADAAAPKQ